MWHHVVVVIQAKGLRGKAKVSLFVDGKPTGAPQKVKNLITNTSTLPPIYHAFTRTRACMHACMHAQSLFRIVIQCLQSLYVIRSLH